MISWIIISVFGFIIICFFFYMASKQQELFNSAQRMTNQNLSAMMKMINDNLSKTQFNINQQISGTGAVISDIQKKLGALETTAKNMQDIGKDISSLQDILKAPKLRGNLGEYLLEDLLRQMFPLQNYEMKHSFRDGTQVDAIIRLGDNIVPIDSKFPMESFQRIIASDNEEDRKKYRKEFVRSVKERIDEIADKYIKPSEKTYDFAMMYIPAENIFYETIINDTSSGSRYEIFNYAIGKHVIPTSPNSFYAYLMAIAYGLRGFRIEQKAREIIGEFSNIQESFNRFYEDFNLVGKHLGNASAAFDRTSKEADKFNSRIGELTGNKMELSDDSEGKLLK